MKCLQILTCTDLAEITYRFTNCDSDSHDGPSVNDRCASLYKEMESPIATPQTLFQFESGTYQGAQGFRLPRDDLYNITIAGASGGEGVCNYHYGLGGVISAQVRLTTDYEYLILVGQKGTSVCDVPENVNHPVCQQPRPTNLPEAQACHELWLDWTDMFGSSGIHRYNLNGGGGGGGASMIWPRRVTDEEFTDLPIVISPGGGGASGVLTYEVLASFLPLYNLVYPRSASNESQYTFHANGHLNRYSIGWQEGVRGLRLSENGHATSGAGSGWYPRLNLPLRDIDGKLLSQRNTFAEGGLDCSVNLLQFNAFVFTNVFGGYGGGGGGCGSGGGGGGYTGGHVIGNGNTIPGSGGDAGVFDHTELPLVDFPDSDQFTLNDGDGYMEIVASNCGCDGECVVYTDEREFECLCPNDTLLAEDGSSCYQG